MDYQTTPATAEELEGIAESAPTFVYAGEKLVGQHEHPKRGGGGITREEFDALAADVTELKNRKAPPGQVSQADLEVAKKEAIKAAADAGKAGRDKLEERIAAIEKSLGGAARPPNYEG